MTRSVHSGSFSKVISLKAFFKKILFISRFKSEILAWVRIFFPLCYVGFPNKAFWLTHQKSCLLKCIFSDCISIGVNEQKIGQPEKKSFTIFLMQSFFVSCCIPRIRLFRCFMKLSFPFLFGIKVKSLIFDKVDLKLIKDLVYYIFIFKQ